MVTLKLKVDSMDRMDTGHVMYRKRSTPRIRRNMWCAGHYREDVSQHVSSNVESGENR